MKWWPIFQCVADNIILSLKVKEVYGHVIQGQASAGWLMHFKRWYSMKNVKLADETDSVDQEDVQEF